MSNLLYFDIEYANSKNKSICQMGLMIEDSDTKEPVYPELEILVNPDDEFENACVAVHHIAEDKVNKAKKFNEIWPDIEKYFINSVVVGYNICSSDLDGLCKNLTRYKIVIPELWYIDVYEIVKDYVSPSLLGNFKLYNVCEYFDIDTGEEHNAFDDACACADLFSFLTENYGIDIDKYIKRYNFEKDYTFTPYICNIAAIREINVLLGEINGMLSDGKITSGEASYLIEWRRKQSGLSSSKYGKEIIVKIDEIIEDGIVTFDEVEQLE